MSYSIDNLLPSNAKYIGFVDSKKDYNPYYDITWSFTYSLTGEEHAFCTFLTALSTLSAGIPGQHVGYLGSTSTYSITSINNILTEDNLDIFDESGGFLMDESLGILSSGSVGTNGLMAICFDSTGLFALSSSSYGGVGINNIKKNSLIIRQGTNVIYNESLSSLDTSFQLASATKFPKILRFRYANQGKKLYIDWKYPQINFKNLLTLTCDLSLVGNPIVYPAFSYTSPVSSLTSPSTLWLRNFHTQGVENTPTYETASMFVPLTSNIITQFTTISGISAYKI